MKEIVSKFEPIVKDPSIPEEVRVQILKKLSEIKKQKLNILLIGATGVGKSSTINALFQDYSLAKVGQTPDPETMNISLYEAGGLKLWDTPGLGDGVKDSDHIKSIVHMLRKSENGQALIDLVLVLIDGSSRDLGTSYNVINDVVLPNFEKSRVIIAINQADAAMKGRYWNSQRNEPETKLIEFLDAKVESIRRRIKEATGVTVNPIYYSAGYKEDDGSQAPYNLSKLLFNIVESIPESKRLIIAENLSKDKTTWQYNDTSNDYNKKNSDSFEKAARTMAKNVSAGAAAGAALGSAVPVVGTAVGAAVGAAIGFFSSLFG
jgi:uncharacterized protein